MNVWGGAEKAVSAARPRVKEGRRFAVLGGEHEAQSILALLCGLGLDIVAHHAVPSPQSVRARYSRSRTWMRRAFKAFGGEDPRDGMVPTLGKRKFAKLINEGAAELIVGSYRVDADGDRFLDACDYAARELGYNGRILHLSALCDIIEFPGRRHLLTGIASSGNMIFQNLLEGILAHNTSKPLLETHAVSQQMASFALNHLESIRRVFSEAIADVMPEEVLASGTHVNFGQCLVQKDDQYCALSGLPLRSYAWGGKWTSSHEPLGAATLEFYKRQGYEIIYILRHPLDVIVSNAAKISTVLSGRRRPRLALDNLQWFEDIVSTLCKHYEVLCESRRKVKFVRYEFSMAEPVAEVRQLATYVGVDLNVADCRALWNRVQGVPIAGERHFWDPRAGKWKEHLGASHRDIVLASKLPELARTFQYEFDAAGFSRGSDEESVAEPFDADALQRLVWIDAILEIPIGKPVSLIGDLVRIENEDLGLVGFFDGKHEARGRALMHSPSLALLVRSALWNDRNPVPSTVRAYLGL